MKIGCAVVMGAAIPAMHYTAMAAVSYTSMPMAPDLSFSVEITGLANTAIVIVTFVLLGCVFFFRRKETVSARKAVASPAQG
jgi:NO-binding membrane sensor protein with MHYT domain